MSVEHHPTRGDLAAQVEYLTRMVANGEVLCIAYAVVLKHPGSEDEDVGTGFAERRAGEDRRPFTLLGGIAELQHRILEEWSD